MRENLSYVMFCNIYRFVSGIIGTVLFTLVFGKISVLLSKKNRNLKCVRKISKHTLGIYVFSVYFLNEFIKCMTFLHYNFFIVMTETIIITIASVIAVNAIEKNRYLNILLLGGR